MQALEQELKALIISSLQLEDLTPDEIDSNAPLFVDGLGLDSIDALELGVALQKRYQIKLDAGNTSNKEHFRNVRNLALFISAQQ